MGPVMIGPSSSHTAGAAKLGRIARYIFAEEIEVADIKLHGSFATTYRGHGTDRAVVGGILGFRPDDERIKSSLQIAKKKGVKVNISTVELRDVHPNTLVIVLKNKENMIRMVGSSIGGGNIRVGKINNYQVSISGQLPTLWVIHKDRPGMVGIITSMLGSYKLNIAFMQDFRMQKGSTGSSIIELDQEVGQAIIKDLVERNDIDQVRYIPPLN
jgi:L-serine dehydratase